MKKKFGKAVFGVAAAGAILAGGGAALAAHQFPDVPNSHPFHDDIDFLVDRAVTGGFGDGEFKPDRDVTRGQMARFMTRLADALTPTVLQAGTNGTISPTDTSACEIIGYVAPNYEQQATIMAIVSVNPTVDEPDTWINPEFSTNLGSTWIDTNNGSPEAFLAAGVDTSNSASGAHAINPGGSYDWRAAVNSVGNATTFCDLVVTITHRMPGDPVDPQNVVDNPQE